MSHRTKRLLRIIGLMILVIAPIGGLFSYLTATRDWASFIQGLLDTTMTTLFIGSYVLFLVRGSLREPFSRLNFSTTILVNSFVYFFLFLLGRVVGQLIGKGLLFGTYDGVFSNQAIGDFFSGNFLQAVALLLGISLVFNFLLQMNALLGPKVLGNFVIGTYHRPIEEERIFMFIDLIGSTTLAEKLGNKQYLNLLNRFFSDLTDAVLETQAEIYEYVGDEVVVSWKFETGLRRANCLRFFFLVDEKLDQNAARYQEEFGLVPSFRAALHGGTIVAGEIGDLKQEIAYVGDILNTTSRLEEFGKSRHQRFVVSAEIAERSNFQSEFACKSLGSFVPRGSEETVTVYSVSERSPSSI